MNVHLVDGTYELFRHYYAVPSARDRDGREIGAVRGVVTSVLGMISGGATHIAAAHRPSNRVTSLGRPASGRKNRAELDPDRGRGTLNSGR